MAGRENKPDDPQQNQAAHDHWDGLLRQGGDPGESKSYHQEYRECDKRLIHTPNASTVMKQVAINAPELGTAMTHRQAARRRAALYGDAQRVIRRRYAEFDLALVDVAEEIGCSGRQLQRILRAHGHDFRTMLLAVRMGRARELLSGSSGRTLANSGVARRVGYRNPSGLRQAFRRYWNLNPSEVRPRPEGYLGARSEAEIKRELQY